jgi:uncharacterized protein YlxW (UPF0749 family)
VVRPVYGVCGAQRRRASFGTHFALTGFHQGPAPLSASLDAAKWLPTNPSWNRIEVGEVTMRKFCLTSFASAAMLFGVVGCQKSVESERQDVREAQQDAAEDIADEQKDVHEAAKDGAAEVREEQRDVEDAAAAGAEEIKEEQRDVEDAVKNQTP